MYREYRLCGRHQFTIRHDTVFCYHRDSQTKWNDPRYIAHPIMADVLDSQNDNMHVAIVPFHVTVAVFSSLYLS